MFLKFQKSTKQEKKIAQTRRTFNLKTFQKHDGVVSAHTTTPRQKQTVKTNFNKSALNAVLPWLFDNGDSNVKCSFPLSLRKQNNLYFWLLFEEKA